MRIFQHTSVLRAAQAAGDVFDVVVVGAGPGGYVSAIKAAQLGLRTALVEKRAGLGGTCLNVGCMPSKVLLHATEYLSAESHARTMGIELHPTYDLAKLMAYKDKTVLGFNRGIEMLCKKYGVEVFKGTGRFSGKSLVIDGERELVANRGYVIATGSSAIRLFDSKDENTVTSDEAIAFKEVPRNLVVIGGGVIGVELGSVWARLGSNVTILESSASGVLSAADTAVSQAMTKAIRDQGILVETGMKVSSAANGSVVCEGGKTFAYDKLLQCVGRRPNTTGLGLDELGVKLDGRGYVSVTDKCLTNVPNVYAIGDVCSAGTMLAHKAEEQGIAVAETLAGHSDAYFPPVNHVPCAVYTSPEAAWVGQTEAQARSSLGDDNVKSVSFPFAANSRSKALGNHKNSFVKMVTKKDGTILGVHAVGPYVSEVISTAGLAMKYGASDKDLATVCTSHPTYAEALKEAAMMSAFGKPIHA